jgi:outer membrane protein, multidrug efflux system
MKMKNNIYTILFVTVLAACNVGKKYQRPEIKTPETFSGQQSADTAGIADIPWKQFFPDPALQEILVKGIQYNNDLLLATKRVEIAQQQVKQSKVLWYPEINGLLSAQYNRPSENSITGISANSFLKKTHIENFLASVNVSWELNIWGKIKSQKEAALAEYLQSYEGAKAVQTQLVADISQGYYNLLMLDRQLEIANKNLALNDTILNLTQLLKTSGDITALGVQQAYAQRQSTLLLIPQIEQDIRIQENALSVLTGQLPGSIARSANFDSDQFTNKLATGVPAIVLAQRPDVRAAEYSLIATNARVGIAKSQMYPVLNITAGGGVESFQFKNWFDMPNSLFGLATGALAQPVFNRRRLKTNYEVAKLEREQDVIRFKQSVMEAASEVENALVSIEKLDQQYTIAGSRADTLNKAVYNARLLFKSAMANYLEVITAQGNALQADLELAVIQRNKLAAVVDLYRSLGGGWR